MSEAKVFTVFLVHLLQLPVIETTSHNVIHLYVSACLRYEYDMYGLASGSIKA